jgi:hypothetical protein
MKYRTRIVPVVAMVWMAAAFLYADHVPDLPVSKAAWLIAAAPEFYRYATLSGVRSVDHAKDSMDRTFFGQFTLRYRGNAISAISATDARTIAVGSMYIKSLWTSRTHFSKSSGSSSSGRRDAVVRKRQNSSQTYLKFPSAGLQVLYGVWPDS